MAVTNVTNAESPLKVPFEINVFEHLTEEISSWRKC
jgi:hypothetical protein